MHHHTVIGTSCSTICYITQDLLGTPRTQILKEALDVIATHRLPARNVRGEHDLELIPFISSLARIVGISPHALIPMQRLDGLDARQASDDALRDLLERLRRAVGRRLVDLLVDEREGERGGFVGLLSALMPRATQLGLGRRRT